MASGGSGKGDCFHSTRMTPPSSTVVWLAFMAVIPFAAPCAGAAAMYTVTDLGTLGGSGSAATAINNAGQVVGWANTASGVSHAFLYSGGQMQDLGALSGTISVATGINNSGQIVGSYQSDQGVGDPISAFLYTGGQMQDIGIINSIPSNVAVGGINDSGQFVGQMTLGGAPFLNTGGQMYAFAGFHPGWARMVNSVGQVVGATTWEIIQGGSRGKNAFLYSGGQIVYLNGSGPQTTNSDAYAINNAGQVVGYVGNDAFLYSGGIVRDLGTIPGGLDSRAYGINNSGEVVGSAGIGQDATHAFLYAGGSMVDLNGMIGPASGWTLEQATAINDVGQIVGFGLNSTGQSDAFLLTPTPEPATLSLLALGSLCVVRGRRRQSLTIRTCWSMHQEPPRPPA
jgi:probable HAF family extracellular repeat protein